MRRPTLAALLSGALLALPAAAHAGTSETYRLHPRAGGKTPLPALIPAAKTTLAFHAPHGYVFTVEQAAGDAMRAAGARPLYPEAGLWGVDQEQAPALRRELQSTGQLVDVTVDTVRPTRILQADDTAPEPLLPVQYMFDSVGTAGLEPPPGGDKDGVLVIDSGLDITHPDFAGRPGVLLENPQKVRPNVDGEWHGTAVSSTIAAARNNIGMSGLYPTVRLGMWDGGGDGILTSETLRALRRAAQRHYRVVNMSFGGEGFTLPELLASYRAFANGLIIVAAAGNENGQGNPDEYPALFPHVMTVAAVDDHSKHAEFSNRKDANDVAAPGVNVVGAVPQAFNLVSQFDCDETSQWCAVNGTSFSAPIASAATAWVWAARPDLEITQVYDLMRFSARDVGPKGFDRGTGFGVIDVKRALARKAPRVDPLEPNDDIILVDGRLTGKATRLLLPIGVQSKGIRARLDFTEDPYDVYRVALRKGDRLRATVRPLDDDVDLVVWPSTARSIGLLAGTGRQDDALGRSVRGGFKRDSVVIEAPRAGTYYVDVHGNGRYDLVLQRLPRL